MSNSNTLYYKSSEKTEVLLERCLALQNIALLESHKTLHEHNEAQAATKRFREHAIGLKKMTQEAQEAAEILKQQLQKMGSISAYEEQVHKKSEELQLAFKQQAGAIRLPPNGKIGGLCKKQVKVAKVALDHAQKQYSRVLDAKTSTDNAVKLATNRTNWAAEFENRIAAAEQKEAAISARAVSAQATIQLIEGMRAACKAVQIPADTDQQFQWVKVGEKEWLSNGTITFPRPRPVATEWRFYPIPTVEDGCWEGFLNGLEGKYLHELLTYHQQYKEARNEETHSDKEKAILSIMQGKMWAGNSFCEKVSIGVHVIFILKSTDPSHAPLFVVDNPGTGAIYIFTEYNKAESLATGSISRSELIAEGQPRVIHRTGWETDLELLLNHLWASNS